MQSGERATAPIQTDHGSEKETGQDLETLLKISHLTGLSWNEKQFTTSQFSFHRLSASNPACGVT